MTTRLCLSNDPLCSGCNPCGECARRIFQVVMPKALAGAGLILRGNEQQVLRFFDIYATEWVAHLNELAQAKVATKAPHQEPLTPPIAPPPPPPPPVVPIATTEPLPPVGTPVGFSADGKPVYVAGYAPVMPPPEPLPMTPAEAMKEALVELAKGAQPKAPEPAPEPSKRTEPLTPQELATMAEPVPGGEQESRAKEGESEAVRTRAVADKARLLRERMKNKSARSAVSAVPVAVETEVKVEG